jgi:hypothetical protein
MPETAKTTQESAPSVLKEWTIPEGDLQDIFQATQRSLDTVTHLTEYEDDKANRVLTPMAFVSALAGVTFVVIPSRYPLSAPLIFFRSGLTWQALLLSATYLAFSIYALFLIIGVAMILNGVRPTFNVPTTWKREGSTPASRLFFEKIAEVSPTDWARFFTTATKSDLMSAYIKDAVLESHLIAQKIGLKLNRLKSGFKWLFASTVMLGIVLPLIVATLAFVPERPDQPGRAIAIRPIDAPDKKADSVSQTASPAAGQKANARGGSQ